MTYFVRLGFLPNNIPLVETESPLTMGRKIVDSANEPNLIKIGSVSKESIKLHVLDKLQKYSYNYI